MSAVSSQCRLGMVHGRMVLVVSMIAVFFVFGLTNAGNFVAIVSSLASRRLPAFLPTYCMVYFVSVRI